MLLTSQRTVGRSAPLPLLLGAVGVLVIAVLIGSPPPADGAKARSLGNTSRTPRPSCPGDPCEAIGSVTGFQQRAGGKKGIFKAPDTGNIVAWTVKLARPDKSQREFFGDFYRAEELGTTPAARVSILKPKGKSRFKLMRHSPAVALSFALGGSPLVTVNQPLRVTKGDVVALTIPTWLPNFAVQQSREDSWRASRSPKKCSRTQDIKDSRPHGKVGAERKYGCRYATARLLYWAYYVPKKGGDGSD
jgi:hypothetical protein